MDDKTLQRLQANDPTLKQLDLSRQNLTRYSISSLVEGLQHNTNVRELNLSGNFIDEFGIREIAELLAFNDSLLELRLQGNKEEFGYNQGMSELIRALITNRTLTFLDLSDNPFDALSVADLSIVLRRNQTLQFLDLTGTGVTSEDMEKVLRKNYTLQHVVVDHPSEILLSYLDRNRQIDEAFAVLTTLQATKNFEQRSIVDALQKIEKIIPEIDNMRKSPLADDHIIYEKFRLLSGLKNLLSDKHPYEGEELLLPARSRRDFNHPQVKRLADLIRYHSQFTDLKAKRMMTEINKEIDYVNSRLPEVAIFHDEATQLLVQMDANSNLIEPYFDPLVNSINPDGFFFKVGLAAKKFSREITDSPDTFKDYLRALTDVENQRKISGSLVDSFYRYVDRVPSFVRKGHDQRSGVDYYQIRGGPNGRFHEQQDTMTISTLSDFHFLTAHQRELGLVHAYASLQREATTFLQTIAEEKNQGSCALSVIISPSLGAGNAVDITIANIGNSAAFYVEISEEGLVTTCELLNSLHTGENPNEMIRIIEEGGDVDQNARMSYPGGIKGLKITRFIGEQLTKDDETTKGHLPEIFHRRRTIPKGRGFILVVSDGFFEMAPGKRSMPIHRRLEMYLQEKLTQLLGQGVSLSEEGLRELVHLVLRDESSDNITALLYALPARVSAESVFLNVFDGYSKSDVAHLLQTKISDRLLFAAFPPDVLEYIETLKSALRLLSRNEALTYDKIIQAIKILEQLTPNIAENAATSTDFISENYRILCALRDLLFPKTTEDFVRGWQQLTQPFSHPELQKRAELEMGHFLFLMDEIFIDKPVEMQMARYQFLLYSLRNYLYEPTLASIITFTLYKLRFPEETRFRHLTINELTDGHRLLSYDEVLTIARAALLHHPPGSEEGRLLAALIEHPHYHPLIIENLWRSRAFLSELEKRYPSGTTFRFLEEYLLHPIPRFNVKLLGEAERKTLPSAGQQVVDFNIATQRISAESLEYFKLHIDNMRNVVTVVLCTEQLLVEKEKESSIHSIWQTLSAFFKPAEGHSREEYEKFYETVVAYFSSDQLIMVFLVNFIIHTNNPFKSEIFQRIFPSKTDIELLIKLSELEEQIATSLLELTVLHNISPQQQLAVWRALKEAEKNVDTQAAIQSLETLALKENHTPEM